MTNKCLSFLAHLPIVPESRSLDETFQQKCSQVMKNFLHAKLNGHPFHTLILMMSEVFKVDNHTFLLELSSP